MADTARDRLTSVEELFAAAKALPTGRRAAFLAERCGGDDALRIEVAELLELDLGADDFLAQPADPWIGRRIDRWRVLQRLGAGGMGVVYVAARDDGVLEQKVALKLLKQGVEGAAALDRFRRERQVLASLSHVNIARLIDGGATAEGIPYFVMEHVEGTRLDQWCDQRRLPIGRRLALFRDVCAAVQYAHQNLVIHRDLKPSNVLVTEEGVAKLLDFGIAKVLEPVAEEAATRTLERRLTPEYSSPEVVRGGAITTASDVFSLGVILYELLAGTRPWRAAERSPTELERAICETTPTRPSACAQAPDAAAARDLDPNGMRKALRGDLDAIVMTALATEPQRRYASVEALVADLDRHLAHLPIVARPPGAGYLLSKFVRRNRALVAAALVALLALAAGAAGLVSGSLKARREAAATQRQFAATQRVNRLLREMLLQLEPNTSRGFANSLLKQLHHADAELGQGLLKEDPEIELDLRVALGRVYGTLGYAEWASKQFAQALALAERVLPPRDPRRVKILFGLGWAERNAARETQAIDHQRAAIAIAKEAGGQDDDLCLALNELGLALTTLRRFDEADAALNEALARLQELGKAEGPGAAGTQAALALLRLAREDLDGAEPAARTALALCEKLAPDVDAGHAVALDTLARILRAKGEFDEAEALLERSLAIRRELFDAKSPVLAWSLELLGNLQVAAGRPGEAVPLLEEALEIRKSAYDADSFPRFESLLELGMALVDAGEADEALPHLRAAVALADRRGFRYDPLLARARAELARVRAELGE